MKNQKKDFNEIVNQVDNIQRSLESVPTKEEFDQLKLQVGQLMKWKEEVEAAGIGIGTATGTDCSTIDIIDHEVQLRISKKKNLVMHGLSDSNNETTDLATVKTMLAKINNVDIDKISIKRLGAFVAGKHRPIVIKLSTRDEVFRIIKNKNKLLEGVSVATDKTDMQRAHLKKLYQFADNHNSTSAEKVKVKYDKGIAKVVPVPKN